MMFLDFLQFALFLLILAKTAKPLGLYLEKVFNGDRTFLSFIFQPLEKFLYRILGVDPEEDQPWKKYSTHLFVFSAVSFAFTYSVLRFQHKLPLNPQGLGEISSHLAINTAMSFMTNTNWQSYGGESTMSYLSQMVALTSQNFFSAAVGIAAAVALIRGLARKESKGIGNFWADLIRCHLYVLLPICLIFSLFLISQGVIQNFMPSQEVITLEGAKQIIAQGPVASQVAIKMLGTNGGGFFNANAAHPYENPTPLSNFIQMLSIFLI
jgi:K+-transporting ATPase ATPase A chain